MTNSKLGKYRKKRDFARPSEPRGCEGSALGNRFIVHKHSATADHYDLRLRVGDVLKSWAVPKGPSLNPDDKRLAVEIEDHPSCRGPDNVLDRPSLADLYSAIL